MKTRSCWWPFWMSLKIVSLRGSPTSMDATCLAWAAQMTSPGHCLHSLDLLPSVFGTILRTIFFIRESYNPSSNTPNASNCCGAVYHKARGPLPTGAASALRMSRWAALRKSLSPRRMVTTINGHRTHEDVAEVTSESLRNGLDKLSDSFPLSYGFHFWVCSEDLRKGLETHPPSHLPGPSIAPYT